MFEGLLKQSGWNSRLVLIRLAQHVAATPHGLDVVLAPRRVSELLAQLTDEHVDDLDLWLVHAAVELVENDLLGQRGALAQAQKLQNLILLGREVQTNVINLRHLGIEPDDKIAGLNY